MDKLLNYLLLASLVFVLGLLYAEPAHAQAGDIYSRPHAQVAGEVWEAQVVQVATKEVEASYAARAAGASIGGVLGMALASRSGSTQNRFAINTAATVLGGLIGERTANYAAAPSAQEILLRVQQPGQPARMLSIVQPAPFEALAAGENVYVTITNGAYRVIRRGML